MRAKRSERVEVREGRKGEGKEDRRKIEDREACVANLYISQVPCIIVEL